MSRIFNPYWLVVLFSIPIALVAYRFLALGLEASFPDMGQLIRDTPVFFVLHVAAAPVALLSGVFQFMPGLRARRPGFHRWTGRIYVLAILLGGVGAMVIAPNVGGGPVAATGFFVLGALWIGVTARALWLAMDRKLGLHRKWMIRSFALTFAAVTLRLYLPFFFIFGGMEYPEASNYVAWLCWVPNLIFAEWYIRRRRPARKAVPAE